MSSKGKVAKSYYGADPVEDYCIKHSTPMHPVQLKLVEETLQHARVGDTESLIYQHLVFRAG